MNTSDAINRIKSLRREATKLAEFHDLYDKKYAIDLNCDKKGYGFGVDPRFEAFTVVAKFSSYAGYYGSSSCSKILAISDEESVKAAFIKALNLHQRELFATAARLLREEAAKLTTQAEVELEAMKKMIADAKSEV